MCCKRYTGGLVLPMRIRPAQIFALPPHGDSDGVQIHPQHHYSNVGPSLRSESANVSDRKDKLQLQGFEGHGRWKKAAAAVR